MDVSSLFNVLVSTFAVMLLGYLLPKLEYVDRGSVGKGLGGLVAKLLLPAVLFKQMADLHIGSMDKEVVLGMLLAKVLASFPFCAAANAMAVSNRLRAREVTVRPLLQAVLFVATDLLWLWTDSSPNRGQKAALAAIATCNQSDTAIGLAVLPQMFSGVGADFEVPSCHSSPCGSPPWCRLDYNGCQAYVAVGIAMNLLIVVPIGMTLIFALAPDATDRRVSKVASEALLNPIVAASVVGLAVNLLKGSHALPDMVAMGVNIPASAFSCCALFMVGHGILEATRQNGSEASIKEAIFLSVLKLLIMPILLQTTLKFFNKDNELLEFGYIYGTVPTAPSTIVVATQAGLPIGTICYAIMISTLAWGPLCFIGAIIFNVGLNQESEIGIEYVSLVGDVLSILSVLYLFGSELIYRHDPRRPPQTRSPMQRCFFLLPLLLCIALFSTFDFICRTMHRQYYFIISDVARQGSSSIACLLVIEGLLEQDRCSVRLKWAGLFFCLLLPAACTAYYEGSGMEMVPEWRHRCWWRWPTQQKAEVFFDVVVLGLLGLVIWYKRKTLAAEEERFSSEAVQEAVVREREERERLNAPLLLHGEKREEEDGKATEGRPGHQQVAETHTAATYGEVCPEPRDDPMEVDPEADEEAGEEVGEDDDKGGPRAFVANLEGFAVLLGFRVLCMLFILVNVNVNNSGAAGWTVVLIIATILVSSFGVATALFFKSPAYRTLERIVEWCRPCRGSCEDYCEDIIRSQSSARAREVQNATNETSAARRRGPGYVTFGGSLLGSAGARMRGT